MKHKKRALFQSVISLIVCLSMLVGTTFAWFTDTVSSTGNIIKSGNLKVGMKWTADLKNPEWKDASIDAIFYYSNWEPGYTDLKYLQISNTGNLAFQYQLTLEEGTAPNNGVSADGEEPAETQGTILDGGEVLDIGEGNGTVGDAADVVSDGGSVIPRATVSNAMKLAEVIDVYYLDATDKIVTRQDAIDKMKYVGTLADLIRTQKAATQGVILPEPSLFSADAETPASMKTHTGSTTAAIMLKMREDAGNAYMDLSPEYGYCVKVYATQYSYEADSFGKDYDSSVALPGFSGSISGTTFVETDANGLTTAEVSLRAESCDATVPAGVQMEKGTTELSLAITKKESSDSGIEKSDTEELIPLDIHITGVSPNNTTPIRVNLGNILPEGMNIGNVTLYHVEGTGTNSMTQVFSLDELDEHNEFYYDPVTGNVTVSMATFSEVALVADTVNAWEGKFDYTWYDTSKTELTIANADQLAAFGAIVGGMAEGIEKDSFFGQTVKLLADINLDDDEENNDAKKIFYPIGYYYNGDSSAPSSTVYSFEGTFDGQGHTISNFYQNTWEIKGDYDGNYYKDGMGLFGKVYGGTVENLTVDNFSSDGEFATTGVIAAYADGATFKNISIFNCNPRVYNIGNGGIVGCVGWYAKAADQKTTFKNITVDNSNKISALWGSYDVACGGIVGQYYPTSGQSSANYPVNGGIHFENCHVAAIMDVYNDVCGNYQYYAYRYAGMMIGSVRENEEKDGHLYPNMNGITASDCTINYGDWNDYYYCEFESNGHPSYSGPDDYKFSRVDKSEIVFDENGKATGCTHSHSDAENNRAIHLPFDQLFTGYGWGVTSKGIKDFEGIETMGISLGDQEVSVEKFETKFTGDFLYRVGNQNTVSVGSLFAAKEGVDIHQSGVVVTIDKVYDNSSVTIDYKGNATDWKQGTIKFNGTGVVKISIQDYNFCKPTVLYLEVVDAANATGATSATSNNVVLLNDCGFNSLEVSGGYTLYGNGFTMTCSSDSAALDMGYSFVTLNNGTLDNVQIVCPNFDYAVLYKSNMTESGNRSETTDRTRYYNVKSGVMVSGNSQILNSRVSGARAAVNVTGGNCVIGNSRIELGAVASLLVGSANSLTLRDVTLVQKPTASTYDSSKMLMGFSVLFVCDANGDAAPVTLEGTLVQNAWVNESDKQYVPSAGQSIINTVLGKTDYLHDIDGDGKNESLNLGFAYMPESVSSKVNATTITDNRTNKNDVPYDYAEVSILSGKTYVYSYQNTSGTADEFKTESDYVSNKYGDIITVTYSDTADGLEFGKSFGTDGWVYELNVDLDKQSGYTLDFSKLCMSVNGILVTDYMVDGMAKPADTVAVTAGSVTYTLTASVNGKNHTAYFKVIGTETTKESPSLVASNYAAALLVGEAGSTLSKDTWHGAAPALEGIQIKYWSVAEKQYKTINLSDYTPTTAGKQNGSNTTWTYSPANGDFTLSITGGQVHSSNNVSAIPVVCGGKLYFVAATSSGLVNYGNSARTIPVTYSFKDNNAGKELTFSHTWSIECADKATAYDYSDFCSGTSKTFTIKSSNGNTCVTGDTLIMFMVN